MLTSVRLLNILIQILQINNSLFLNSDHVLKPFYPNVLPNSSTAQQKKKNCNPIVSTTYKSSIKKILPQTHNFFFPINSKISPAKKFTLI